MKTGVELIEKERRRQVEREGYTPEHDDGHDGGEIAMAAACYASPDLIYVEERHVNSIGFIDPWPWDECDDKRPHKGNEVLPNHRLTIAARIHQLVKAGALIAAEIDRLQRLKVRPAETIHLCSHPRCNGHDNTGEACIP